MDALARRRLSLLVFWGAILVSGIGVIRLALTTGGHPAAIILAVLVGIAWVLALAAGVSIIRDRKRRGSERDTED